MAAKTQAQIDKMHEAEALEELKEAYQAAHTAQAFFIGAHTTHLAHDESLNTGYLTTVWLDQCMGGLHTTKAVLKRLINKMEGDEDAKEH